MHFLLGRSASIRGTLKLKQKVKKQLHSEKLVIRIGSFKNGNSSVSYALHEMLLEL